MKSEAVLERAAQVCADRGGKLTTKRRQVLAGLLASDKALSAYDLADKCKEAFGVTLFPMSIYRILEFLETVGLVHRLKTTNKFIACAHIACDHAHDTPQFLICRECNRVEEVGIANSLSEGLAKTLDALGFRLMNDQVELECVCHNCSATA